MRKKLPQPWYRPVRGLWYVTLDGKQHNLGPDEDEAFNRYEQLLRSPKAAVRQAVVSTDTVVGLIDKYLDWCQENRAPATYEWYRWRLQLFVDRIDVRLKVADLRHYHLDDCLRLFNWSSGGKRNLARAVQRAMRWAVLKGYINASPLAGYEKPRAGKRNVVISPEEFQRLLGFVRNRDFLDLLEVTWETGCRPQESLIMEARYVDLVNGRWIIPVDKAKGEEWPRGVYLNARAQEITERLVRRHPKGSLFRNSNGKPWTTDAVNCCFTALQHRMGQVEIKRRGIEIKLKDVHELASKLKPTIRSGGIVRPKTIGELEQEARRKLLYRAAKKLVPKYCLYHLRHSWLDRALKSGVDALTCAILMGHRDPSTISRVYQHLNQSPDYLRNAACRATA